jgi:hypothetical protein
MHQKRRAVIRRDLGWKRDLNTPFADVDSKFSNQGRMLGQKLIIRFESQRNTLGNTKGLCDAKI